LSYNKCKRISGLDSLTQLAELNLSYNAIEVIDGLTANVRLRVLNLAGNHIAKVQGTEQVVNLHDMDLSDNLLDDEASVRQLSMTTRVKTLGLKGNKVADRPNYRAIVLHLLPHLLVLDGATMPGRPIKASRLARTVTTHAGASGRQTSRNTGYFNRYFRNSQTPTPARLTSANAIPIGTVRDHGPQLTRGASATRAAAHAKPTSRAHPFSTVSAIAHTVIYDGDGRAVDVDSSSDAFRHPRPSDGAFSTKSAFCGCCLLCSP
jgi:hypothetical protein